MDFFPIRDFCKVAQSVNLGVHLLQLATAASLIRSKIRDIFSSVKGDYAVISILMQDIELDWHTQMQMKLNNILFAFLVLKFPLHFLSTSEIII